MWRLACGCTSESHHLYGVFMAQLLSAGTFGCVYLSLYAFSKKLMVDIEKVERKHVACI